MHEEGLGSTSGIKRYGEVLTAQKLQRGRIPVTMRPGANPEVLYYYFVVQKWIDLPQAIEIRDRFKGKSQFTNKFLLDHCTKAYQLFAIPIWGCGVAHGCKDGHCHAPKGGFGAWQ